MLKRTLVGAAILGAAVACYLVDAARPGQPAWAMAALGVLLALGSLEELLRMSQAPPGRRLVGRGAGVAWIAVLLVAGLLDERPWISLGDLLTAASAAVVLLAVLQVRAGPGPLVERLSKSLWFMVPYVGGVACLMIPLMSGHVRFVMGLAVVVKCSDIAAYFVGRALGKHPLAPLVSPKKTIEGAVAGVVGPAIVAVPLLGGVAFGADATLPDFPWVLLHGIVIGALAVASNLTASLLKRARRVKDSGQLFGEAGGWLDLADSLLLVGPFAVAYTALA